MLVYLAGLLMFFASLLCHAQTAPEQRLRIVGGLGGVTQYTGHEEQFWTRDLATLSGGRYTASIVPFDRAGVPGQEMLNLMQLGVVPFGTALLSQVSTQYPELGAADMAGLNPDVSTLRRTVGAFRPYLAAALRERYGAELLAVYIYPAQEVFCNKPLQQLSDLAGRRTRVSSSTQADFIAAVGGTPVYTEFSQIMANMRSGNTDCAVTGTMSGHTLGLHEVTSTIYTLPLSWGVAVFAANRESFNALPADLQALLRKELPKLENAVWTQSERETDEGIACNTGAAGCTKPTKGRMTAVRPSPQDEARRREIFANRVLPGWVRRCGPECAKAWNDTLAPVVGLRAPSVQ
ncbi:ABC transporter substrate-binding protein [Variovorax paradoxus]|jgi:TRAP-type C4-dicarboxylate transport system substrate-binding protein|uniref:ABC transporter substrate-binding protein n=2 Tax=Comamonadaceae TaxID=80864 RepID=A0AA91DQY8_VARPD|nr:ABC transporter substrate-binding protein [Variovorax paradoxus]